MPARCLETRRTPEGFRRRRYEQDGVRFTTIEVPMEAWTALNRQGRGNDRAAARQRHLTRARLRGRAVDLYQRGWKPLAISHDLGVPVRTIQRWTRYLRPATNTPL
jgi:hypothetical protein